MTAAGTACGSTPLAMCAGCYIPGHGEHKCVGRRLPTVTCACAVYPTCATYAPLPNYRVAGPQLVEALP